MPPFTDEPLAPGLRGGPGALAVAAALAAAGYGLYELFHDYDHRRLRSVPVVDHPKIVAIVDKKQRQLALAIRGAPGTPANTLTWRLRPIASPSTEDGYPPAFTIVDEHGTVMGSYYSTDEVLLSDAGERGGAGRSRVGNPQPGRARSRRQSESAGQE